MFKSFAIISFLATGALGQSSSSAAAAAAATGNPLIPSGISDMCQTFLKALNSDTSLTACTSSLITTTAPYGPGGDSAASASAVTSTLNTLCSSESTAACPESLIRGKLAEFYPACQAELTTQPNDAVLRIYDVLYAITPLKTAICTKADNGKYCVIENQVSPSVAARSTLARRADTAIIPNMTAYHDSNLPFLFLNGNLDNSALCTACTKNIITSYISFESNIAYAPGLGQSPLLSGQGSLYSAVQSKCGTSFLSGAVAAAGGLGGGTFPASSAPRQATRDHHGLVAAALGMLTLAAASVL